MVFQTNEVKMKKFQLWHETLMNGDVIPAEKSSFQQLVDYTVRKFPNWYNQTDLMSFQTVCSFSRDTRKASYPQKNIGSFSTLEEAKEAVKSCFPFFWEEELVNDKIQHVLYGTGFLYVIRESIDNEKNCYVW